VPNSRWVEYIPQLDVLTHRPTEIREGRAYASAEPGLGIDWDWAAIGRMQLAQTVTVS